MMVSQNKHLDLSNHYHHASINQSQAYLCRFSKGYEGDQFHFSRNESIALLPCAYLHNMKARDAINDDFYAEHIKKAPVFISPYVLKHTMYRIEHGKIKPSKNLADALASMLDGNPEFLMIDEQKLVYETALDLAHKEQQGHKQTLIVKGGPGTGKSVVAINLLTELIKRELLTQYVSKNAAPCEVFKKMLTGSRKKTHIDNMFKGSNDGEAAAQTIPHLHIHLIPRYIETGKDPRGEVLSTERPKTIVCLQIHDPPTQ